MGALFVPAVHLPHGSEVFKPLGFTRAQHRRILKALSERALLGCSPDDAIVLSKTPESGYLDFLLELGIGTRNIIICSSDKGNLAEDILGDEGTLVKIRALSPSTARFYIHLEEEEALARETGLAGSTTHPALTRMFNTIYFLVRLEEDLEIGALERVQARSSRLEGVIANLLEKHPKLFVRGNESCGGSQAFVLRNADDLLAMNKIVCRNQKITRYFASRFIEGADSWNYQFLLDGDGGAIFFGASRQILRDGYLHEGNEGGAPAPESGLAVSTKLAERVSDMGGRGLFGADILIDGHTAYPAELNMRENTSTPVLAAQKKLGARYFRTDKLFVPRDISFETFSKRVGADLLPELRRKSGILPFNFASAGMTGYLDVALFGESVEEIHELRNRLSGVNLAL